jgi:hypothetical protein
MRLDNDELASRHRRIVFRHSDCGARSELTWLAEDHLQVGYSVDDHVGVDQKSRSEIVDVRVSDIVTTPNTP